MDGDPLYWFPSFADQTSFNGGSNSTLTDLNSTFATLTYNVTNQNGRLQLFMVPTTNYAGPVTIVFNVSYNSQWSLYEQLGLSLPAYDEQY